MFLQTYRSSQGVELVVIDPDSLNLRCKVDPVFHKYLTCTLELPNPEWKMDSEEINADLVKNANELIQQYARNISSICRRLGFHLEGNEIELCRNFHELVSTMDVQELDLSGLGIDCLPIEIGMLDRVENLNLARNALRVLPPSLTCLKNLKVIDLTGNPIADNLPSWFSDWIKAKAIRILGEPTFQNADEMAQEDKENLITRKRYKVDQNETQNSLNEVYT